MNLKLILAFLVGVLLLVQCTQTTTAEKANSTDQKIQAAPKEIPSIELGASQMNKYIRLLKGKRIALVVNQTSRIGNTHLVDTLISKGINIQTIFAPEHGFRGKADAGEKVADGKDKATGIPLISLYGKHKKPTTNDLKGIDWVLFDIQDVGARFYTYISTMHNVMEACAEHQVKFMVLDRPNPNGHYVDGPILDPAFKSFVGMHPVPIVHGLTIGEYARMINGENWLKDGIQCRLTVVPSKYYSHDTPYELPVKPSPNLPNIRSIYLYPSLCLFEGTVMSVGRGTNTQFQVYGHPDYTAGDYQFTPVPMEGAKYPKHQDKICIGKDLRNIPIVDLQTNHGFDLGYLIASYQNFEDKEQFFLKNLFFDKLAGTDQLRQQIIAGLSEAEIRASWAGDLEAFKEKRAKYLMY